jgi:hypothetical protein
MRGESACRVVAPVFWQVQLAINEAMAHRRHVGEYVELTLAVLENSKGTRVKSTY